MRFFAIVLWGLILLLAGCAQSPRQDYLPEFHRHKPRSILILPVVNQSVDVEAPLALMTTLPRLLAEQGYYVFPINTVKTLLEFEGLYEAAEVHATPPGDIADLFGADSILYLTIHEWTTQYLFVHATTIVDIDYKIVGQDGELLWSTRKKMTYSPDSNVSGNGGVNLLAAAIGAALERAVPKFIPLAREANEQAFKQGVRSLPPGPYARDYDAYYLELSPSAAE